MKDSPGKTASRKLFYEVCLPKWLTPVQLRSGDVLILMGEHPREIPLIEKLGILRRQVYSVERDENVFRRQSALGLGINLYFGDVSDFLKFQLNQNHAFTVLNLDVEGTHLNQLDQAMVYVMLFCWRNPETVVATYSTSGRDHSTLLEGIVSLALFLWLAPDETVQLLKTMTRRYQRAGFTEPVRMVLRDLFWLRSLLENTIKATQQVLMRSHQISDTLVEAETRIWREIKAVAPRRLTLTNLAAIVSETARDPRFTRYLEVIDFLKINIHFDDVVNLFYNAQLPWSQRCFFTKFRVDTGIPVRTWVKKVLTLFSEKELIYVDRSGKIQTINQSPEDDKQTFIIWEGVKIYRRFRPRRLPKIDRSIDHLDRAMNFLQRAQRVRAIVQPEPGDNTVPKPIVYVRRGELTEEGRAKLKALANQGLTTTDILRLVPKSVPERTVRAYVAHATRRVKTA